MFRSIKNLLIPIYSFSRYCVAEPDFYKKLLQIRNVKKKIVLIGSPIHGNVGDHLICEAEENFFRKEFPDYIYIDCTMPFSRYFIKTILKNIHKGDYLVISGGGWLGSEWKKHEDFVRKILSQFKEGNLVIFPQTVFYRADDDYVLEGIPAYQRNKHFLFCVRDKYSYDYLVKHNFCDSKKIHYMPDFALYYKFDSRNVVHTKGRINVCLRDDIEAILSKEQQNHIINALKATGFKIVKVTSDTKGLLIKPRNRSEAVKQKIIEIANCELLVTDRLHAMIMAALSETRCIAFDNSTHKVAGVFKWISHLSYIRLVRNDENITETIMELLRDKERECKYNSSTLSSYFSDLAEKIKTMEG